MKRREFIAGVGGAVVTWPLAAGAQQAGNIPRIGVLSSPPDNPLMASLPDLPGRTEQARILRG